MSLHLERQVSQLKRMLLAVGAQVEEALLNAIKAIEQRDDALARSVIERDRDIDLAEIIVEEECLHTLALYQPVAFDLRFLVAVLKINNELERIGDLAVNIAQQAEFLVARPKVDDPPYDLAKMTQLVRDMVQRSLDALVNIDADKAGEVRAEDDRVDQIHREMFRRIEAAIREDPELVQPYIHLMSVSRHLERIADHAVNIAEDVIYMAKGEILRHHRPHPLIERR
jgi:phosphate transport system protein